MATGHCLNRHNSLQIKISNLFEMYKNLLKIFEGILELLVGNHFKNQAQIQSESNLDKDESSLKIW